MAKPGNFLMKVCLIKIITCWLLWSSAGSAQINFVAVDTIYKSNFLFTNLYNDINLANLNSIVNYTHHHERFGITVGNYYMSNVSKLGQNFFRDYNNFRMIAFYNVKKNFDAGIGFQNRFLTDDKNVETNKNNSSYFFTNLDFRIDDGLLLNSKLGLKTVDQIGEYNQGFSGVLTADMHNYNYKDYLTNGKAVLFYENLVQKQNHNYELSANIYKRFTNETDNTGNVRVYNHRNDVYFPATQSVISQYNVKNNIEKRVENYFQLGDMLNYSLNRNMNISLGGNFIHKNITREFKYKPSSASILLENVYDTKIIEDNIEFFGTLSFNWYKILSQMRMTYYERSENHALINSGNLTPGQILELEKAEKNRNNNSRRTSVLLDAVYYLSNTNSFGAVGSASLLRYDTDFDENFDDRDELETIFSTFHRYNNLLNFEMHTRFDIILSNLSYIFSQKSANNYKNRIYKLTSESSFRPVEKLLTKNLVQVLANYTVYDYEDIISQVQSFSYRQLSIKDSTLYAISKNFEFNFNGELKFYEQGQFNNEEFSVKPIAFYVEQYYLPEVRYFLNYFIQFGIGYKYFQQQRFQYENSEKKLANTFRTLGPIGKITLYLNNESVISLTGGVDYIKFDNPVQENSAVSLHLNILWNM